MHRAVGSARAQTADLFRRLADNSTDMLALHDARGRFVYVSPSAEGVLGYRPEELLGTEGYPYVHPDDLASVEARREALLAHGGVQTAQVRAVRKGGEEIWIETTMSLLGSARALDACVQSVTRDVTERVRTEATLRRSQALHRTLIDNLPDAAIFLVDRELRVLLARGHAPRQLPWVPSSMFAGRRLTDLGDAVPERVLGPAVAMFRATFAGEKRELEIESDGVIFEVKSLPIDDERGNAETALVVVRDVTARRRDATALEAQARRQRVAAELGQRALRETDLHAVMRAAARAVTETLGLEFAAVLERRDEPERFFLRAAEGWRVDPELGFDPTSQAGYTLRAGGPVVVEDLRSESRFEVGDHFERFGIRSGLSVVIEGRERPFGVLSAHACEPRRYGAEEIDFLTTVATVVSAAVERHRDEQASRHNALHDRLTGLPNRTLALDRLEFALRRRRREGIEVAVLVVDLDGFKLINDSLGHRAGDELLAALAPRLRDAARGGDTVARLGGDEFAVICQDPGEIRNVITVAERLSAAVARPFLLAGAERFVTASIGIAAASGPHDDAEAMLRDADVAMYWAKAKGRGQFELFDEAMRGRVQARLRTETELRRALERDELRVHYQPMVSVGPKQVAGVEALVRWEHPLLGLRAPDQFVGIAEETGLIVELGEWVLMRAAAEIARLQRDRPDLVLSVNVSARQLAEPSFGARVAEIVRASGLRPGTLALEVTETALIEEAQSPRNSLETAREHGLQLWLDDFGTGYSSLGYLKRFDLDGLKIDRGFVAGLGTDSGDTAIVQAIASMAQALDLRVVAEGVETELQLALLEDLGCDRAQGYLFSGPCPAWELETQLALDHAASRFSAADGGKPTG